MTTNVNYSFKGNVVPLTNSIKDAKNELCSLADKNLVRITYIKSFHVLVDRIVDVLAYQYPDKFMKTCPNGSGKYSYNRRFICNIAGLLFDEGLIAEGLARTIYSCKVNDGKRCKDIIDYNDPRIYPTELSLEIVDSIKSMAQSFKIQNDRA